MKKLYFFLMAALLCTGVSYAGSKKVAFICEPGYNSGKATTYGLPEGGYATSCDPVFAALSAAFDVTTIETVKGTEVDYDDLRTYDCVVISEAITGNATMSNNLVQLVGTVPIVSMKAYNYTSGRWSWAAPSNPSTKTGDIVPEADFADHALFQGLDVNTDGSISLYDASISISSNRIQGFAQSAIIAGSLLEAEQDKLYAKASGTDYFCIHEIANAEGGKKYVLVSMSSDNIPAVNANGQKIIINAVNYVTDDAPAPEVDLNIAYLYDSSYNNYCGIDNDPIFNNSKIAEQNATAIDIKSFNASNTDTLAALENFDLVVVSEAIGGTHKFGVKLVELVNRVPMVNFKSFFYANKRWAVGSGVNPTSKAANDGGIATIAVAADYLEDELFADVAFEEDSLVTMFVNYDTAVIKKNLMQAYTANADGLFGGDDVIAKVYNGETAYNAIHRHGTKNMYILLPISSDAMFVDGETNLSDNAMTIINNAIDMAAASKGKVSTCVAPTVSQTNGDQITYVTLATATDGASLYYTLDGTDPTTASSLYSDTLKITADSTVVKAFAAKQGFDASAVTTALVRVYSKPAAPAISVGKVDGKSTVTITAAAGVTVYYNFVESEEIAKSAVYSAPIELTRPMTVSAFAYNGAINSELVSEAVEIQGLDPATLRDNEFARFDANTDDWYWETTGGSSKVAYYMGKSAMSMYSSIDTIINANDTTYDKHERDLMVWYAKNDAENTYDNGWKLFTMGQLLQWENTDPQQTVGKAGDAAYNCDKPEDLLIPATKGHITLTSRYSGEGFNAGIQSTRKFQGPFDIVSCVGNNNSDGASLTLALAVSEDGETWTPVDTLGVSYYKRFWTTHRSAYNEAKEVYVRAMQAGGGTKLAVYDIILLNAETPEAVERVISSDIVSSEYYDLNGRRLTAPAAQGITLVKNIHADGNVSAEKIVIR